MILTDIYIPSLNKSYDFHLDESVPASVVIREIVTMVSLSELSALKGNPDELILCSRENGVIVPGNMSLRDCGIDTGSELILL